MCNKQELKNNIYAVSINIYPHGLDSDIIQERGTIMTFNQEGHLFFVTSKDISDCETVSLHFCKLKGTVTVSGHICLDKSNILSIRKYKNRFFVCAKTPIVKQNFDGKEYIYRCRDLEKLLGKTKRYVE